MPWDCTFALWANYMTSDPDSLHHGVRANLRTDFPSLRIRGKIALIGVSTARPSAPFLAVGRIGREQLQKIEKILSETRQRGLLRIMLIHHPPAPGMVSWRKSITDGAAFCSSLARHGAELILHGHVHRTTLTHIEKPAGWIPVIGVPSASALGRKPERCARYHMYCITRRKHGWDIHLSVRSYSPKNKHFIAEGEGYSVLPPE
jgi:3',5'-cyclic AMP phosphodiesterase CpdA